MDGRMPPQFGNVEDCVEQAISRVGRRIVLCAPIGAGKPVALVNAFYHRAAADPGIELAILTGLTLARPRPASELERRLVEPITARIFGNAPEPAWTGPLRAGKLPPNIRVQEFFMEPGAWLHAPLAQQSYASINYTHVARSVLAQGANVVAQQVARRPGGRVSLGTNPDVTADLIPMLRERERAGQPVAVIGQVNDRMPFMFGAAEMPESGLDFIVDDPRGYHELIAPPNGPIPTAEHAIALAASLLVRDGGTIQIGIGELGDAIVHALTLRHRSNADWRRALADIGLLPRFAAEQQAIGGDAPFERGLYAVTEMFVDGFLDLYREGILKRRAGDGALLHGAFLLGPRAFYEELRAMPDEERALFRMMPVSFTNELLGPDWESKVAQRRDARFINSAMMATLGGAIVSDGLEDGRVVSGVGGQFNFVAQAHDLPGGRSIIAVRATRASGGEAGIEHPLELRPRDDPAAPARHRADRVRHRGYPRPERRRSRGRDDRDRRFALPGGARGRREARRQAAAGLCRSRAVSPQPARGTRAGARAAPGGRPLRIPALWHGFHAGGDPPRRGAARTQGALGNLGGKLAIAAKILRPLPRDAALAPLFERMGLAAPRGFRERLLRRLVAAAL